MRVRNFDFSFNMLTKKMEASCMVFKPDGYNYPMYRVVVPGEKNEDVYIFYKVNEEKQKFFWFENGGFKDTIAKGIAKGLERHLDLAKSMRRKNP